MGGCALYVQEGWGARGDGVTLVHSRVDSSLAKGPARLSKAVSSAQHEAHLCGIQLQVRLPPVEQDVHRGDGAAEQAVPASSQGARGGKPGCWCAQGGADEQGRARAGRRPSSGRRWMCPGFAEAEFLTSQPLGPSHAHAQGEDVTGGVVLLAARHLRGLWLWDGVGWHRMRNENVCKQCQQGSCQARETAACKHQRSRTPGSCSQRGMHCRPAG